MLDFGVVRAHSRHTLKVVLSNPTQLPMMLQLRQFKAESFSQDFDCLIVGSVLGIVKCMQRLSRCGKGWPLFGVGLLHGSHQFSWACNCSPCPCARRESKV